MHFKAFKNYWSRKSRIWQLQKTSVSPWSAGSYQQGTKKILFVFHMAGSYLVKTSPSLYPLLQNDGLLALPSIGYLKQISSSFSLETGLSTGVCSYLKTRIASLSQEEKTVVLMIDEVLVCEINYFVWIDFHFLIFALHNSLTIHKTKWEDKIDISK